MGFPDGDIFTANPDMPLFKASSRQYGNLSIFFKYMSTETCSNAAKLVDAYTASLFDSTDCDRDKYRMKKLPNGVNIRNLWKLIRQIPLGRLYKIGKAAQKDPEKAKIEYKELEKQDLAKMKELEERGFIITEGLEAFAHELFRAMSESFNHELGILFFAVLPLFKELDKKRREGKTEEIRNEFDALCSGYEGDPLMQMNIDIYRLARMLPEDVWNEYPHERLGELADRIQSNLNGKITQDLPEEFLDGWRSFMDRHGWDGLDQLFPSCPRYRDDPMLLLVRLRQNVGGGVKNPSLIQQEQLAKRRDAMVLHERHARKNRCYRPFALGNVQQRNLCLDHLMWIRNSPKTHLSYLCGIVRAEVLKVERDFLASERLERKGDIFHIDLSEVDKALRDSSFPLMDLVRRRKIVHERALRAKECPLLVDSRCRILRPDPPEQGKHDDGVLIGAAVSPGIATGRVRIVHDPSDQFEKGEVLAAVVTSPPWTPLFAGAAAVVLQIGGVLQHGALCAREYGKPAVSNINILSDLKTGMTVEVDGNSGTVKILDENLKLEELL